MRHDEDFGRLRREDQLLLMASQRSLTPDDVSWMTGALAAADVRFDWGRFMWSGHRNRVLPLAADAFARADLILDSDGRIVLPVARLLTAEQLYWRTRCRALAAELSTVLAALADAGVKAVARKGVVLGALVYGDVGLRPARDMDILIRADDAQPVLKTLRSLGYEHGAISRNGRTVVPLSRRLEVFWRLNVSTLAPLVRATSDEYVRAFRIDARFDLMEKGQGSRIPAADVLDRARITRFRGEPVWMMEPADILLDLCVHLHREAVTLSTIRDGVDLALIKFVDICEAWSALDNLDADAFVTRALDYGVAAAVYYALHFTDVLFPGRVPVGVLDRLRPADLSYLDEYGRLDGHVSVWSQPFLLRLFDEQRAAAAADRSRMMFPSATGAEL